MLFWEILRISTLVCCYHFIAHTCHCDVRLFYLRGYETKNYILLQGLGSNDCIMLELVAIDKLRFQDP